MTRRASTSPIFPVPARTSPTRRGAILARAATVLVGATLCTARADAEESPPADAALGEPDKPQLAARPSDGAVEVQPKARQFSWPNRPDVGPTEAKELDEIHREVMRWWPPAGAPSLSGSDNR